MSLSRCDENSSLVFILALSRRHILFSWLFLSVSELVTHHWWSRKTCLGCSCFPFVAKLLLGLAWFCMCLSVCVCVCVCVCVYLGRSKCRLKDVFSHMIRYDIKIYTNTKTNSTDNLIFYIKTK